MLDIIWLDGYDVTQLPLVERKRILKKLLPDNDPVIKYSDHVETKGEDFFKIALKQGLEGIMAKKTSSTYKIATRSDDWVKIKVNQRQEVVIAGFTQPRNTRKYFGSLLLGLYDDDKLVYVGHTGSGFNGKSLEAIYQKLQPLITDQSPFDKKPKTNMPATWVKPKLVCEIKFSEWTKDRMARHPIFMGLRDDKKARDVIFEKAKNMVQSTKTKKPAPEKAPGKTAAKKAGTKAAPKKTQKKSPVSSRSNNMQVDLEAGIDQVITINGHELKLTNLNKIYWKKEK